MIVKKMFVLAICLLSLQARIGYCQDTSSRKAFDQALALKAILIGQLKLNTLDEVQVGIEKDSIFKMDPKETGIYVSDDKSCMYNYLTRSIPNPLKELVGPKERCLLFSLDLNNPLWKDVFEEIEDTLKWDEDYAMDRYVAENGHLLVFQSLFKNIIIKIKETPDSLGIIAVL